MIVDTHVHVWEVPPVAPVGPTASTFTRLPDEAATAEELLADMDANGVDVSMLVQSSFSTWDNGYIADSAKKYSDRFVGHGLVDPMDPDNAESVRYWMQERGLVGFRFHPMYYDEPILDVERNVPMWEALAELSAVVQVHMSAEHAPQVDAVADRYPTMPILLDHMSYPNVGDAPGFGPYRPILDLASHSNVYVKISDVARRSEEAFPYRDVQQMVKLLYGAFGIERMLWGTGYPGRHRKLNGWLSLTDELRLVHEGFDWLSDGEKDQMLGRTATSLWSLSTAT